MPWWGYDLGKELVSGMHYSEADLRTEQVNRRDVYEILPGGLRSKNADFSPLGTKLG